MTDLKVGDVVELNSGGPKMTVVTPPHQNARAVSSSKYVTCKWFNETESKSDTFPVYSLRIVEEKKD